MSKNNINSFKIIISHVYSKDNKGDAALLSVLINDIQKVFKDSSITILTLDLISKNEKFEGIMVQNSFMFYAMKSFKNRGIVLLYSLYVMSVTLLWSYVHKFTGFSLPINRELKNLCQLYDKSDLILPVGGGYLRSQKKGIGSILNVALLLHPILLSHVLKKPTILYTQSIGPFTSRLEESMVSRILNSCVEATLVREDTSAELLKHIGVSKNIYRGCDSGFAFKARHASYDLHKLLNVKKDRFIVGVTARRWLSNTAQSRYEHALAKTVRYIVTNYNAVVVFIPQVTAEFHGDDDRIVHKRIHQFISDLQGVYVIDEKLNHYNIKAAYDSLDFVIGTRFHSVIFSLTSYVPVIAIEYEHKTGGIMHDLGLDKWVLKMEEVNSNNLCKKIDMLIKDHKKYRDYLKAIMPDYIKKNNENIKTVKKHYDKFIKNNNPNY